MAALHGNFPPFTLPKWWRSSNRRQKRHKRTLFFQTPPMPPKKAAAAAAVSSDSEELSDGDDELVWQDDINWEHYAPTRGLNPSLCVRTRIFISMAATRLVTMQQRRDCWTAVGDFPLDRKRVLDAMGAEEPALRKSSRHAVRTAAEEIRDLAFASDQSDGTLLRKVRRIAAEALCTGQIAAIGLAKVGASKGQKRKANNVTQQGCLDLFVS